MKLQVSTQVLAIFGASLLALMGCSEPTPDPEPEVVDPAVIAFAASETDIVEGDTITLSWETQDAATVAIVTDAGVELELGGAAAAGGSVDVAPEATTIYTLTARGEDGSAPATHTVTVRVSPPTEPVISAFTATPATIALGETSILAWETQGVSELALVDGAGAEVDVSLADPVAGSVVVTPGATTTYTLTGRGRGGEITEGLTLTVLPPPVVDAFGIDPGTPELPGAGFTLAWETTDVDRLIIGDALGRTVVDTTDDLDGSVLVHPDLTTAYTLRASGPGGEADPVEAIARVLPVVDGFTVDAATVRAGDFATFTWSTRGGTDCVITGPDGFSYVVPSEALAAGSTRTVPQNGGEYVLALTSGDLGAEGRVAVTVTHPPQIGVFTADPGEVTAAAGRPAAATLSWTVTGAEQLQLVSDVQGTVDLSALPVAAGSLEVPVAATQTFTLTAVNATGQDVATAQVVAHPPAVIDSLTAGPELVGAGDPVTLSWQTTGAVAVALHKDGIDLGVPPGDLDGSFTDPAAVAGAEYSLVAGNLIGDQTSEQLTVPVGRPAVEAFSATPTQVAPNEAVVLAWEVRGGVDLAVTDASGAGVSGCSSADPARIALGSCTVHPSESDVYTLTVSNGSGPVTADAAVTVYGGPVITGFTASEGLVTHGDTVDLTWRIQDDAGNVPSLTLADNRGQTYDVSAADPLNGTFRVTTGSPATYIFTLTAQAPGAAPATATATVEVIGAPVVDAFAADPTSLDPDSGPTASELTWATRNAVEVSLYVVDATGNVVTPALFTSTQSAQVAAHGYTVSPTETTGYTLIAENAAGAMASADVLVVVGAARVVFFNVSPAGVQGGQSRIDLLAGDQAELEWNTAGADRVTIVPTVVAVGASTEPFIDVSQTGTQLTFDGYDAGRAMITFPAGFRFPFFGVDRTEALMATDGYLAFDLSSISFSANDALPDPSAPHGGLLVPFWDDQDWDQHLPIGRAFMQHFPAQGGVPAHLVIQVVNAHFWTAPVPSDLNYEIILYETGVFEYRYGTMTAAEQARADGSSASIGFENEDGTDGYRVIYNSAVAGGLSGTGYVFDPRLATHGTKVISPSRSTPYVLTAYSNNGPIQASVQVSVWPDLASGGLSLSAAPTVVQVGESYTLSWAVTGATSSRVLRADSLQPVPGCSASGYQSVVGSCSVTANAGGEFGYVLEASNPVSSGHSPPVTVRVD